VVLESRDGLQRHAWSYHLSVLSHKNNKGSHRSVRHSFYKSIYALNSVESPWDMKIKPSRVIMTSVFWFIHSLYKVICVSVRQICYNELQI